MMKTIAKEDIQSFIGYQGEPSPWFKIEQERIDAFAATTLDNQFIHVDVDKAKATPFGSTIAHGFLNLSLMSYFAKHFAVKIEETRMLLNYGLDRVRFILPVKVNSEVRAIGEIVEISEKTPQQLVVKYNVTIEIKDEEKPALVAEWLIMYAFSE
jgi:acyl dehydratase